MEIKYKIEFFSNWHCGSGLASGADLDELVIKDAEGLPFVPGKTMKGLLREAFGNVCSYHKKNDKSCMKKIFGYDNDNTEDEGKTSEESKGYAFFSNADLEKDEKDAIISRDLIPFLYQSVTSTKIDNEGIAANLTLRKIQTTVPCILYGHIYDVPEDYKELFIDAFHFIKRIGLGRNRGYGRCQISIE